MDRIQQAIKKAVSQSGRSPFTLGRGQELGDILYTQTRVQQLDPIVLERNRIVAFNKNNPLSISFDMLRTQILQKMQAKGWRTLAVVSPTPLCGKTVTAINLAMSISHHTSKTAMLVDFSLRNPKVAEYLGLKIGLSLNDVLLDRASVADVIINPNLPKLVVVPTAEPMAKAAELLASNKVRYLIHELRQKYPERIVIFDLPALSVADDAISVLPQMDCALLVVGCGDVSKKELLHAKHQLDGVGFLGTVFNKAE